MATLIVGAIAVATTAAHVMQRATEDSAQRPTSVVISEPATPDAAAVIGNGAASFTIKRAPDSHFYAEAQVNGAAVRFMVDTGASKVVLTAQDALNAGIGAGDSTASAMSAAGPIQLMPATAERVALGPLAADNVSVMVAKEGLPVSLLGQSYLARIGTVSIEGDTMTLR